MLAGETITDQWLVLHKRSQKINELNNDIYWLYGCQSNRFAIYLSFTAPGTLAEFNLVPGSTYDGKLCYYKGVGSLRALFKECELSEEAVIPHFCANLQEATARYREAPATEPICRKCTRISRKSATGCSRETTLCAGCKQ